MPNYIKLDQSKSDGARRLGKSAKLAALTSDAAQALLRQATALHGDGRFEDAGRIYLHVHERNPDALAAPYFLALMDIELGRLESALDRLRYVTARDPQSFEGLSSLAYVFQELGFWPQCVSAYQRALALKPGDDLTSFRLTRALQVSGRMDESLVILRGLAAQDASRLRALLSIAQAQPSAISPDELSEMQEAAQTGQVSPGVHIALHFALGEILERQGKNIEAFAAFTRGNALKREQIIATAAEAPQIVIAPPSSRTRFEHPDSTAERHTHFIGLATKLFDADFFARQPAGGHASRAPIFIVGMPRSGSSLLEQILSSHDKVTGVGEASALWQAIYGLYARPDDLPAFAADPAAILRMGEAYLEKLRALGWRKSPFIIDKMLGNYVHVGLIHLLFPKAIILHSVRDPVDTCLSCYRQLFRTGNETTYDLGDLGRQYVRYREMMAHWERVLPGRVTSVNHEDLVRNPGDQIRKLVTQDCGLKWDDACLRFFATKRPVRTASVAQVRKPIFQTSVERWRRYEAELEPLFYALGRYVPVRGSTSRA